jgi:hypothetical protein
MIAFALTALAAVATSSDPPVIRCPAAVVDSAALRSSLAIEAPEARVQSATCEPTGRAGAARIVFELEGGEQRVIPVGDVPRSLRPRAAALALAAALASKATPSSPAADSAPGGTADGDDVSSPSPDATFAPASWSLDAAGQFAYFGHLYAGGELSRRIALTGWRPAASPFGISLVLAVSLLGTDAWQPEDVAADNPSWAFAIWARTGIELDFAVTDTLRVGPELLVGGGGDLLRDGTIGYGLASAGVHLGWALVPGVELVFAVRAALQWNTSDADPGVEATFGVRFPLRSLEDVGP